MDFGTALWMVAAEIVAIAAISKTRAGARVGVVIAMTFLSLPALVGAHHFLVALLALPVLMVFIRALDFAHRRAPARFSARALHLLVLVDTRRIAPRPVSLDAGAAGGALLAAGIGVAAWLAFREAATMHAPLVFQWAAIGLGLFAVFESSAHVWRFVGAWRGKLLPPLSDAPQRSTSLTEFWGRRWNPVVGGALREYCFLPVARGPLGVGGGLAAAFVVSAIGHFYIAAVSLGARVGLMIGAFFLIQPVLLLLEHRLRVRRWSPEAGWLWTLAVLAVTAPLILEPMRLLLQR